MTPNSQNGPSRTRHMRADEVAWPTTLTEADAALAVVSANVQRLEGAIARYTTNGWPTTELSGILDAWTRRRVEIQYARTRITEGSTSGESATALRAELDATLLRVATLEREREEFRRRYENAVIDGDNRLARMREERDAAVKRRDVVFAHLKFRHEADKNRKDRTARLKDDVRSLAHRGVYAIRSMQAAGALLTPVAAKFVRAVRALTTDAHYDEFLRDHAEPLRAASIENAARNGATCEEPDALRVGLYVAQDRTHAAYPRRRLSPPRSTDTMQNPIDDARPLRCYTNGTNTVSAYDEADALVVAVEAMGGEPESEPPFRRVPDDALLAVAIDGAPEASTCACASWTLHDLADESSWNKHRRRCDVGYPEKTAAEWVAEVGRGLIASTEM